MTLYSDVLYTQPLTTMSWGNPLAGTSQTHNFWIKNTGQLAINSFTFTNDMPVEQGSVSITAPGALGVGNTTYVSVTVNLLPTAGGACPFNVTVTGNY
jgi:hypothetical protein